MALVPRLADEADSDLAKFSTPADGFGALGSLASNEVPVSVTTLKPSALEKIQEFLIRGERKQACHYALDEKLWAHAMVIASSTDRDAWQEVVKEFIRAELGSKEVGDDKPRPSDARRGPLPTPTSNGRESLRVAYSLFAGQGAASGAYIYLTSYGNRRLIFTPVQAMLPPAPLSRAADKLAPLAPPPSTPLAFTPTSPHFAANLPTNVPVDVLARWAETVAMMISNPASPETPAAMTALGDHLSANQWIEAAHAWYGSTSRICPRYEFLCAHFQLPIIPTDITVRRPWVSYNPLRPRGVCQPGCLPGVQQGSRPHDPFRDCGVRLLTFHTAKRTGTIPWTSSFAAVQADSSPPTC